MIIRDTPMLTSYGISLRILAAFIGVLVVLEPETSVGDIAYSSRSTFDSAAGSSVSVMDFEASSTASNINSGNSLGGVTFTYSFGSVSLKVVDSLAAPSGTKSLGTDDFDMLADGDDINLSFAEPQSGFGLYVTSSDALINGDVRLTANGTVASLVALEPQIDLGGGRFAWFLGVQASGGSAFTSASLSTHGGGGLFNYNLDDFVSVTAVPEPSSLGMISVVAGLYIRHRGRRVRHRN